MSRAKPRRAWPVRRRPAHSRGSESSEKDTCSFVVISGVQAASSNWTLGCNKLMVELSGGATAPSGEDGGPGARQSGGQVSGGRSGRIYLLGHQALVRLPMMQRERDRAAGLNTPASSPAIAARRSAATTWRSGRREKFLETAGVALPARRERGPGRHRGLGQPAGRPVPRRQGRRRVRDLVRQGPRRRPLGRRAEARQLRRHRAARRRARARRRRPRREVVDDRAPERAGASKPR